MSSRASGGALAASLITAAIVGFAGGAYFGSQAGDGEPGSSASTPPGSTTPVGETPDDTATDGAEDPAGTGITLTATQTSVSTNQRIDLSGTIEPGEAGVQLVLQRSVDGGAWETFPLNNQPATNADGGFSSWVQTGQSGQNAFRVVRADDESVASNEVQVTVG